MCLLKRLILLLSLCYLASAQTETCQAGEFDINPLKEPAYWEVDVPPDICREFGFPDACTLYMSFCAGIPDNITGCDTSSQGLGPTSLCIANETTGYSMGVYDLNKNPFRFSGERDELSAAFQGKNYSKCFDNRTIQTAILFNCDADANWETLEEFEFGDASDWLGEFFFDFEDPCVFNIQFNYDRVCPHKECGGIKHYNVDNLVRPDYWTVDIDSATCNKFLESNSNCTLYLSFCEDLKSVSICSQYNTTVCLSDGTNAYSFGKYNVYTNPFTSIKKNSLLVAYAGGEPYPKCPESLSKDIATIMGLNCAFGAIWKHNGKVGDASSNLALFEPNPEDPCQILVELNYAGACLNVAEESSSDNENVGWVGIGLLLALIVIVALYLTIGSAVNIARGNSGCPEMLPQFAFWKAFFVAVVEGVYFSANIISCGLCSRTVGTAPGSEYDKL